MAGTLDETRDLSCVPDMTREGKEVTGLAALGERLFRRLTTPSGLFEWWPSYGYSIHNQLLSKTPVWILMVNIKAECMKDEQVFEIIPTIEYRNSNREIYMDLFIVSEIGAFTFTMTVTEANATYR